MQAMSNNGAVRVLVVDDHPAIRFGIASLIDGEHPRLCTVGTAVTADEALDLARAQQPHVVVLDVDLAGDDGLALIPALQRAAPCKVVVLSSLDDPQLAAHARQRGADACLHKTAPAAQLLDHILAAGRPAAAVHAPHIAAPRARTEEPAMPHDAQPAFATIGAFVREEDGVTAIEYGLLAALIAVTCIVALNATGDSVNAVYNFWSAAVVAAVNGAL
jgi:DNA-binding NarL/FixJ family response regulator